MEPNDSSSADGAGAPAVPAPPAAAHAGHAAPAGAPALGRAADVALVVDDDAAVRAVVARQLVRLGWRVHALPSAADALAWLGDAAPAERPGLVVTDVNMPGLSGYELAAVLRRDYPALGVLLLSGRAPAGLTPVVVPGRPPMWLLGKPYDAAALADAVARTLLQFGGPRAGGPAGAPGGGLPA